MAMETMQMPEGEWKRPTADFHLDPNKLDAFDPQAHAERQAIMDQIRGADRETLDTVFDNLSEAVVRNPDIVKSTDYMDKLAAAHARLTELDKKESLH